MRIFWTKHALFRIQKRCISKEEVEFAIDNATITMPGKNPGTTRIIADFPSGRKMSVVFKGHPTKLLVVTAFWLES